MPRCVGHTCVFEGGGGGIPSFNIGSGGGGQGSPAPGAFRPPPPRKPPGPTTGIGPPARAPRGPTTVVRAPITTVPRTFAANDPAYNNVYGKVSRTAAGFRRALASFHGYQTSMLEQGGAMLGEGIMLAQQEQRAAKDALQADIVRSATPTSSLLPTIETAQRQAEPTYLPYQAPTFAVPLPEVPLPTFNQPLIGPGQAGQMAVDSYSLPSESSAPYNESVLGNAPQQTKIPYATPGINPAAAPGAGLSSFLNPDALLNTLTNILTKPQAALATAISTARDVVGNLLPRDIPNRLFTGDFLPKLGPLTGINANPLSLLNLNPQPALNLATNPALNPQNCACKKGEEPKKEKGKCMSGFFRQHEDGSTEYTKWSDKCQSSQTPSPSPLEHPLPTSSRAPPSSSRGRPPSSRSASRPARRVGLSRYRTVVISLPRNSRRTSRRHTR